jgi:hypothetical protein
VKDEKKMRGINLRAIGFELLINIVRQNINEPATNGILYILNVLRILISTLFSNS